MLLGGKQEIALGITCGNRPQIDLKRMWIALFSFVGFFTSRNTTWKASGENIQITSIQMHVGFGYRTSNPVEASLGVFSWTTPLPSFWTSEKLQEQSGLSVIENDTPSEKWKTNQKGEHIPPPEPDRTPASFSFQCGACYAARKQDKGKSLNNQ